MTKPLRLSAMGGASGDVLGVEDVFSTYLYTGNGSTQFINNGIALGNSLSPSLRGFPVTVVSGNFAHPYYIGFINDGSAPNNNSNFAYSSSGFDVYVTFPSAVTLTEYLLAPQGGVNTPYNTPTGFVVLASNDASSWTTIATFTSISTGSPNWDPGLYRTFSFSNTTAYKYWRLQCTGSGSGGAGNSICEWRVTGTTSVVGNGGLVWIKKRNAAEDHALFDTARGNDYRLTSNSTVAQQSGWSPYFSFTSNGMTLGSDSATNGASQLYASWTFRKQAKFFDVVTWTGNGTNNRQISHALGSAPGCIIVKETNQSGSWYVYHRSNGTGAYLRLNSVDAVTTSATYFPAVSSTTFTPTSDTTLNTSSVTYVAYLFAHDAGGFGASGNDNVISCGYFVGTGSEQSINLGWEPQWLLTKRYDNTGGWILVDTMRGQTADYRGAYIYPYLSNAEGALGGSGFSVTPTGFNTNASSNYIYIAIRRGPMKVPTSGRSVFLPLVAYTGQSEVNYTNFTIDTQISTARELGGDRYVADRLRTISSNTTEQQYSLSTNLLAAEKTSASNTVSLYWDNVGFQTTGTFNTINTIYWNFARAPGFFDVVCYTGTGANRTVSHNLGVAPEMMIIKRRDDGVYAGRVYHKDVGPNYWMYLFYPAGSNVAIQGPNSGVWIAAPTSTYFNVGTDGGVNASGSATVAYLFASCPGVSKVGSYTGTGSSQTINCGFTSGARFVLIKRTDSTGDWYVWDTARGIISGNDPYLLLNTNATEVTTTDYISPQSSGFGLTSSAPAALNASGGTYIYLAIA